MIDWRTLLAALALGSLVVVAFLFGLMLNQPAKRFDYRPTAIIVDIGPSSKTIRAIALSPAAFRPGREAGIRVWGRACGGRVKIRGGSLQSLTTLAQASYTYAADAPQDPRTYGQCSITVNSRRVQSRAQLCAILVHEWGHLTGHGHSTNRRSIMYPSRTYTNFPEVCK